MVLLAVTGCAVAAGFLPGPAAACTPNRTKNEVVRAQGWDQSISGHWSNVYANIEVKDPYVWDDPNATNESNGSYTYVMLHDSSASDLAQIGPYKKNDGYRADLTFCESGSTYNYWMDPPHDLESTPLYEVVDAGSNGFYMYAGSTQRTCSYAFDPTNLQIRVETHSDADQVAGLTTDHQHVTNAVAHDGIGTTHDAFGAGQWYPFDAGSWFGASKGSSTTMDFWDGDC